MKKVRNSSIAVLLTALALILGVFTPGVAQASSSYDNLLHTSSTLFVYTDGSTKSQKMDVSQSWYNSLGQAYAARVAQNPDSFPSSFMTELDAARSSGSWGVLMHDSPYGNYLEILGTRDPHASCGFVGDASTGSFQCSTHPGYGFVDLYGFTYNTYGGNGCGSWVNVCSNDGMAIYGQPVIQTGTAGYVMWSVPVAPQLQEDTFYTMRNFDISYPSGYAGAVIPSSPPFAKYVAMGDSYSSGEGNAPYEAGTDQSSDSCHRSTTSYPRKVESALNLGATAFVACSGAKTVDILNINSTNVEYPQALVLSQNTDLVTMTMGGNDGIDPNGVPNGFAQVVTTCLENSIESNCLNTGQAFVNDANSASRQASWTQSYKNIRSLVRSDTKILIIGYPDVFPTPSQVQGTCTWGDGISPTTGNAISTTELNSFASWDSQLNQDLNAAVTAANDPNLHFIDPSSVFAGHGICTSDPWFYGVVEHVDPSDQSGSYHPNSKGEQGYATTVVNYLTAH